MRNIFLFFRTYFSALFFVVLQIIALLMLTRYSRTHEAFFMHAVNEWVGTINEEYNSVQYYFKLKKINEALANENAALRNLLSSNYATMNTSILFKQDTVRIDSTIQYRQYFWRTAQVVGNDIFSQNNYLILNRGSAQGLKVGMCVLNNEGIVGMVEYVSKNYARVMSMLHSNTKVSAILKKTGVQGRVAWDGVDPAFVILSNIPKSEKIKTGDSVLTSHYSNFPPGQIIGTISSIVNDPSSNFYTIKVKTGTNFYTLQFVYVVENKMAEEIKAIEHTTKINP
jgi:rod shape-determining protein MreC